MPGGIGDLVHQLARAQLFVGLAVEHVLGPKIAVFFHGAHEVVVDAHRVVGVLEENGAICIAVDGGIVAIGDKHVRFLFFLHLAFDEFHDVRMVDVQDNHLGRAARFTAALDHSGERVKAFHETDRAAGDAAAGKRFAAAAQGGEICARAGAPLEEHAFRARQPHDGFHGVVHGVDEAGGALRLSLHADVEPYRRVESHFLLDEQVREFVAEGIAGSVLGKIAALFAPANDGVDHAGDQLAHRAFALRTARLPVKILAGHDVGSGLRPVLGNLNVVLAEDGHAFFVADQRRALFPLDGVKRGDFAAREVAAKGQTLARAPAGFRDGLRFYRFAVQRLLYRCHCFLLPPGRLLEERLSSYCRTATAVFATAITTPHRTKFVALRTALPAPLGSCVLLNPALLNVSAPLETWRNPNRQKIVSAASTKAAIRQRAAGGWVS